MTHMNRLAVMGLAVATAIAALTYLGRDVPSAPDRTALTATEGALPGGATAAALIPAPGRSELDELERLIRAYGEQTESRPNASAFAFLGQLELERARLTGDVASYDRAERALARAIELAPSDAETEALLASVRFTTHDFTGAYDLASEIYERDGELAALAVRGDAALELGRYERAAADYATLAGVAPDASSTLVRRARLAYLTGDGPGASRLAASAERAAASEGAIGATRSWYAAYRAKLALDAGDLDVAAAHAARALAVAPDYHVAIATMAAVRAAQGRIDAAIALYERSVALVPDPATLAALGTVYAAAGDDRTAEDRFATVEAIASLAGPAMLYDRQIAVFRADHGGDLEEALAIAEAGLTARRDVYGYDALAWVLYAMGRYEEARAPSDAALALGTPDPRLWFHSGMIAAALGDTARARADLGRALALNPAFDPLQAPTARRTLARLGGDS